jgi:hypothetical protein
MALRGKPREPFYMVGRMEGQSVVLRAEKGKLRLMVDDEKSGGKQEMVYEVTPREEADGKGGQGEGGEVGDRVQERAEDNRISYGGGEVPGSAVGMDGEAHPGGSLPGAGDCVELVQSVAAEGDGGDAAGAGASVPSGQRDSIEPTTCGIIAKEEQGRGDQESGTALGQTSREDPGEQIRGAAAGDGSREEDLMVFGEMFYGRKSAEERLDGGE